MQQNCHALLFTMRSTNDSIWQQSFDDRCDGTVKQMGVMGKLGNATNVSIFLRNKIRTFVLFSTKISIYKPFVTHTNNTVGNCRVYTNVTFSWDGMY